jgi:chemotaxis protein methyltransferase CheR
MPLPSSELETAAVLLAALIEDQTGLFFPPERYEVMVERLWPRTIERNCPTLLDYYYLLKYDDGALDEWNHVYTALAINETYFWREFDQIRAAAETIVPEILHSHPGRRVRIWHAACASGEEPYSMVMALREFNPDLLDAVEIIATDFNPEALEQARNAIYRRRSFRILPAHLKERYFTPLEDGCYQLNAEVHRHVTFGHLNLMDSRALAAMNNYDMILCRNVFIYFKDQAIRRVVNAFYHALNPEGYLFVASAESLLRLTNSFELVEVSGAFGYRKLPPVELPQS